jgi:hypothetical protein
VISHIPELNELNAIGTRDTKKAIKIGNHSLAIVVIDNTNKGQWLMADAVGDPARDIPFLCI